MIHALTGHCSAIREVTGEHDDPQLTVRACAGENPDETTILPE